MKKEQKDGKIIIKISVFWIFVLAVIIMSIMAFFRNYIFATNNATKEQQEINVEPNDNTIDILKLMVENNYSNKRLVNEDREIKFEIEKKDDDQIPKGEEVIKQKGKVGKKRVVALQQYDENEYLAEQIIESTIKQQPKKQIVHVGTSEFLAKYKVHIGEEMYLMEKSELKKEPKEDAETLTTINRYLNLELVQVSEEWTKVKYKEYEGYLQNNKLTSEAVMPKIKEKNRIAKLQDSLSRDMDLSKTSGLTLNDFKTIIGYDSKDKNQIFAQNVEAFYNAEQKYKVNGVFLISLGIHESGWGTSYLAKEKKNLFGYKAYDRDPINSAQDFETYEDCINTVAEALSKNYLTPSGSFYYGTTVEAVNTKYASDNNWHNGVYSYMEYLYDKLG